MFPWDGDILQGAELFDLKTFFGIISFLLYFTDTVMTQCSMQMQCLDFTSRSKEAFKVVLT